MKRLAIILAACTPEAPAAPSFQQDVLPILAANCVRCHGFPVIGGAPPDFRLDTFTDTAVTDGAPSELCGGIPGPDTERRICGAATYAVTIPARLVDPVAPMPPRFPLDDYQIETLTNWAATAERGAPRPRNSPPEIVIEAIARAGAIITVRARVDDADRDLVVGTLRAGVPDRPRLVGALRTGTLELAWDTTGVAPGDYPLVAELDDGAQVHSIPLGTIAVEAP